MSMYTEQHRCGRTIIDLAAITQLYQNVKQRTEKGSGVCVCVFVCVRARARACVYAYLHLME